MSSRGAYLFIKQDRIFRQEHCRVYYNLEISKNITEFFADALLSLLPAFYKKRQRNYEKNNGDYVEQGS